MSEDQTTYDIALSFAEEDRVYVRKVADALRESGVKIFYDEYERANLWGKNLYEHLQDIYQRRAKHTVMFISKHYAKKLWTNHERKSAQARALQESYEYILPARFDDTEVPGLPPTIVYISLKNLSAEDFAKIVMQKLNKVEVILKPDHLFDFSESALADIDFELYGDDPIFEIIRELKSHDWNIQNPALKKLTKIDLMSLTNNQAFVLGRNIYQCACGKVRQAVSFINDLRQSLSNFPGNVAQCLLVGMYYEVYFNSKGEFRKFDLKAEHMDKLFELQTVQKYKRCIEFIRGKLEPYKDYLAVTPNNPPITVNMKLLVTISKHLEVEKLLYKKHNLIIKEVDLRDEISSRFWKLKSGKFNLTTLSEILSQACFIPKTQLNISTNIDTDFSTLFILPKGMTICFPCDFFMNK